MKIINILRQLTPRFVRSETGIRSQFDGSWYANRYKDVDSAGIDPVQHFHFYGKKEGRFPANKDEISFLIAAFPQLGSLPQLRQLDYSGHLSLGDLLYPFFDADWYCSSYPDVARQILVSPIEHYLRSGSAEGRKASAIFDTAYYQSKYEDVASSGVLPLLHYLGYGVYEGRFPNERAEEKTVVINSGLFDAVYYCAENPAIELNISEAIDHYIDVGARQGLRPSVHFDAKRYYLDNQDVAHSKRNPIVHWVRYGRREGRRSPEERAIGLTLNQLCNPFSLEPGRGSTIGGLLVTVVTPAYNTDGEYLDQLYTTIQNQTYANWEWVIVDDGSTSVRTANTLRRIDGNDPRVRVIYQPNSGISEATNTAVREAQGYIVALVDHDDLLSRDVLAQIANVFSLQSQVDVVYTDECKLSGHYEIYDLALKPSWSPLLLENTMYVGHLTAYRADFLHLLGPFRSALDGTQDFDMMLRASLREPDVVHLATIGYLWRAIEGSTAQSLDAKSYAITNQKTALQSYAASFEVNASVVEGAALGSWRIDYPVHFGGHRVSVVIPTAGRSRVVRGDKKDLILAAIESLVLTKFFSSFEIVVVHNGDLTSSQLENLPTNLDLRLVEYKSATFNLAEKINFGIMQATSEFVCLVNDDIEAITMSGGDRMLGCMLAHPAVGVMSCLCLYENETVQHNGVVLLEQGPSHYGIGRPPRSPGLPLLLSYRRECLAVTGAVMLFRKEVFFDAGGFRETLPINYNDVDFCLQLRKKLGLSCIVDPEVRVYHYESSTNLGNSPSDIELFYKCNPMLTDPFFNKGFDQRSPYLELPATQVDDGLLNADGFEPWLHRRIAVRTLGMLQAESRPKITVGVPVFNQPARLLKEALRSILMQTYSDFEVLIVDDGSTNIETVECVDGFARGDRIKVIKHKRNMGIAGSNRTLLSHATGSFLIPVDADDWLTVDALQIMAYYIGQNQSRKLFYSDEFKSDMSSRRFSPFFKPDFDPILLMNCCYPTHLMAMEVAWLREVGAYQDDEATWCHDYDVLTRALKAGVEPLHVPHMLYAWRINPGSTASADTGTKPGTLKSQRFVLERVLKDRGKASDLGITPNPLFKDGEMWMLKARRALADVRVLQAASLWGANPADVKRMLHDAAKTDGWVAVLLDVSDENKLLELSAPSLFDDRVVACSGVLLGINDRILWSGGYVTEDLSVIDPYADLVWGASGYHGQLFCQRRVDVPGPCDLIIRSDILLRSLSHHNQNGGDIDSLLIAIAIEARRAHMFCAITPHVRSNVAGEKWIKAPLDRGRMLYESSYKVSNLYSGELSSKVPYTIKRPSQSYANER